jgi:hypothetical protein
MRSVECTAVDLTDYLSATFHNLRTECVQKCTSYFAITFDAFQPPCDNPPILSCLLQINPNIQQYSGYPLDEL